MNEKPKERTEYIGIRVTPAEKEQIKNLASLAGLSITGFLVGNALGDAIGQRIIAGFTQNGTTPQKKAN